MTTEQKHAMVKQVHQMEVEGLPKGWKAVAIKIEELEGSDSEHAIYNAKVIAEKIKPRSIKVADTGEVRQPKEGEYVFNNGNLCLCRKPERWGNEHQIWRVVEGE